MTDSTIMPKAGIYDASGKLTAAGQHYLASLGKGLSTDPAETPEQFLAGGTKLVRSQAVFQTMAAEWEDVSGEWYPNLASRLHFKLNLQGATQIMFPQNIPETDNGAEIFFSIWIKQPSTGGVTPTYGSEFAGEAPVVLTDASARTLLGFIVSDPDEFTGWTVKSIAAES